MSKLAKALTAAAGNAGGESLYVEDVFSTYLYTGNNSSQTITNNIDLAGEGGLVWFKRRSTSRTHVLIDTERGKTSYLRSNENLPAETGITNTITSFNSDGFSISDQQDINGNAETVASWTFRKAEKFFDVVTYTGTGSAQNIAHALGATPATIIVKKTDDAANWQVYHSYMGADGFAYLNLTNAAITSGNTSLWNNTEPTDSVFTVGTSGNVNENGATYVAYLFASDAGGFGDDGSESIIKCGSYTTAGGTTVNLGFEPQWVMIKRTDSTGDWEMLDVMRGFTADASAGQFLEANNSNAEFNDYGAYLTSTGFVGSNQSASSGASYIYIAIRRPMKTPESGTEVFDIVTRTATNPNLFATALSYVDVAFNRNLGAAQTQVTSRLTGGSYLHTASTAAEVSPASGQIEYDYNYKINPYWWSLSAEVDWLFKRATGFFDVVAYTGTGVARTVNHNLGVAPELMILKVRNRSGSSWVGYHKDLGNEGGFSLTNSAAFSGVTSAWNSTTPTSSVFTVGTGSNYNGNTDNLIAYLFATLAGVSKVGSYTGTAATLNVDCGFSAGARFILIKRTDSTGDWYVWDSARGIVAGNDPYLLLNSTAAEVTSTDYIDPLASGFTVTSSAPAALNASGGNYIFLAIA